jgi:hypothetical protein
MLYLLVLAPSTRTTRLSGLPGSGASALTVGCVSDGSVGRLSLHGGVRRYEHEKENNEGEIAGVLFLIQPSYPVPFYFVPVPRFELLNPGSQQFQGKPTALFLA